MIDLETNEQRYLRLCWEHDPAFRALLTTLARNLAIGAALCEAYGCGCAQHTGPGPFWHPGIEIDRIAELRAFSEVD